MGKAVVKRGGSRSRQQTRATSNATSAGVATEGRADVPAPTRKVVRRVETRPEREYAEPKFQGQRNQALHASEVDGLREGDTEDPLDAAQRISYADRQQGAPIVIESDLRTTAGGGASRTRVAQPRSGRPAGGNRATWMGADQSKPQDTELGNPVESLVDPEAVATEDLIVRTRQAGSPDPTGNPCTCAYEWEEDVEKGVITVFNIDGIATGFRGAPRYMTWCIVCGGERDGNFRPENAIRYGGQLPELPPPVSADEIADQVLRRVRQGGSEVDEEALTGRVLEKVGDMLSSDRFLDTLAERIAGKVGASA